MKIEKKLWITLFVFGLFAIGFSGWIFSQSTAREKLLWDNTIRFETKKLTDGEIKSENIALPEDFDDPRSILFKTTHTIAEVWLDGEKIYEYGNEEDAPSFMKSPGSCWHIVNIPEDSAGKSLEVRIIPVYDNYYGNEASVYKAHNIPYLSHPHYIFLARTTWAPDPCCIRIHGSATYLQL